MVKERNQTIRINLIKWYYIFYAEVWTRMTWLTKLMTSDWTKRRPHCGLPDVGLVGLIWDFGTHLSYPGTLAFLIWSLLVLIWDLPILTWDLPVLTEDLPAIILDLLALTLVGLPLGPNLSWLKTYLSLYRLTCLGVGLGLLDLWFVGLDLWTFDLDLGLTCIDLGLVGLDLELICVDWGIIGLNLSWRRPKWRPASDILTPFLRCI